MLDVTETTVVVVPNNQRAGARRGAQCNALRQQCLGTRPSTGIAGAGLGGHRIFVQPFWYSRSSGAAGVDALPSRSMLWQAGSHSPTWRAFSALGEEATNTKRSIGITN
jgi:hypothetical protein